MGRLGLAVIALGGALWLGALGSRAAEDGCSLYVYMDEGGMLVRGVRLADVPEDKREALLTYRDCAAARALRAAGGLERKPAPELIAPGAGGEGAPPTAGPAVAPGGAPADGWKRWGLLTQVRMLPPAEALWLYASAAAALVGLAGLLVAAFARRSPGAPLAYLALGLLSGLPAVSVLLLGGWPF
ncbi:MAG TPA: hypothetical protein PK668_01535 [Myxococcota bacterium]|nr:hypothetical protein [Myxococcota bacterium]HRY96785.1 hypothetical protein [Myxococcota bacterium]